MKQPFHILLLDDDPHALAGLAELLAAAGYDVTASSAFQDARHRLEERPFDLLVTDVRLRSFNGLHLVMHCRRAVPEMPVMIMTGYDEPLIELEASRYRAGLVRKPVEPVTFLAQVAEALRAVGRGRRGPRQRGRGGVGVTAAGHPAAVVDVSYDGLRLEIPAAQSVPPVFDVEVAAIGLAFEVQPVWSSPPTADGAFVCGATLIANDTPAARTWRTIVDRLSP
jgi:DNA-binding response OmpR family regulator